jgi:hypothetical protein
MNPTNLATPYLLPIAQSVRSCLQGLNDDADPAEDHPLIEFTSDDDPKDVEIRFTKLLQRIWRISEKWCGIGSISLDDLANEQTIWRSMRDLIESGAINEDRISGLFWWVTASEPSRYPEGGDEALLLVSEYLERLGVDVGDAPEWWYEFLCKAQKSDSNGPN